MKEVPNILLIDDSPVNQMLCSRIFSQRGWNFHGLKLGNKALRVLEDSEFDLLILDLELPDLEGIDLARQVRDNLDSEKLPIIALSGIYQDHVQKELHRMAIKDYLIKPLDYDNLVGIVTNYLQ